MFNKRYQKSNELLAKAEKLIPLATQTFSKSKMQFPKGASPFYAKKARGCELIDVDDNTFIDWASSLCPIIVGYADKRINKAVKKQLKNGSIFSIANELEIEVAEKLNKIIPNCEMVRFGKNGSDVTSGAIRLARYHTGRKYIVKFNGHYHGWHSWSIFHVNDLGIPSEESALTLLADYNDLESVKRLFEQYPDDIAAVIMEPMNIEYPKNNFLHQVQYLAHRHGALFILDEVIAGFRFALGGAQEAFGIVPDLACLGKAMGNGFPISALAGRADIMKGLEKVHFSFTFGGDCISLAAANAVIDILSNSDYDALMCMGAYLKAEVMRLLSKYNLDGHIKLVGYPTWSIFRFKDSKVKALFFQECFKRGIFTNGSHNISFSHTSEHIERTLEVYDEVFSRLNLAVNYPTIFDIDACLEGEYQKPAYKVR
jgi:glutamate-1-semialdehyde 2,1-aminomutase